MNFKINSFLSHNCVRLIYTVARCTWHKRLLYTSSTKISSHYDTLEVDSDATQKQIRDAFIRLSKKHHPDASIKETVNSKEFIKISNAYNILSSTTKRAQYDAEISGVSDYNRFETGEYNIFRDKSGKAHVRRPTNNPEFDEWKKKQTKEKLKQEEEKENVKKYGGFQVDHRIKSLLSYSYLAMFVFVGGAYCYTKFGKKTKTENASNSNNNIEDIFR